MVTLTGMQESFSEALKDLLELEYDACSAYTQAIEGLKNEDFKHKLEEFRRDHESHIEAIHELLKSHDIKAPTQGDMIKGALVKGKAYLASLVGDKAILYAMSSNEEDTNTAYERICTHKGLWEKAKEPLKKAWDDEVKHQKWLTETLPRL
jgi:rubrerythrin